jgi:hypothetical protein
MNVSGAWCSAFEGRTRPDDDPMTYKLLHFPSCAIRPATSSGSSSVEPLPEPVAQALRSGICPPDVAFDHFLPEPLRALSDQHWTPLCVALQAAAWLDELQVRTVIDIGSGAGKFCVAAALSGRCHFTGLEHRPGLVQAARALARTFGIEERACFIQGALGEVRVPVVDAYYLYNPFEENSSEYAGRIDEAVELSEARQARDLLAVRELLLGARVGTYVLVYNGFGGKLPDVYREVKSEHDLPNVLRLWRKARPSASRRPSGVRALGRGNGSEGMCLRAPLDLLGVG